ncbi:MAG: bifunctional (p)ppGpp synthetase/guanosine-3',5'-bis(diphosphate) 3'-pyrophosphohydrolase [Myxococcota bacterium]|jgi:GTP pyrophosphokinase|nr:GTP pyrophosphokinase [Deltaproteobacteria bacterium]MCP4240329.1 bifunctional (p)ppGpp synthetase/guanosine-3',5'-bis(diphosphate) 3'-pyrophosphohydrolase [bacterium]MDP6073818.1 bifunctional (p)ppGpp synthetase/guanosine-3',5'-bis(diphosphate) 3'-pyrophosphohydrolase [Myxococcota bacterium]MDP6244716.1 bifunctional (p)ppGpp synthetase/guanosine-3',5'-bis(diphosphate) 3'-pyrophosphohydrolase [Myxococcota bacterium]MDP7075333.1 bifunctional (p)ppGpp synthetase/guanosine-3',5'-bis(diphosphate
MPEAKGRIRRPRVRFNDIADRILEYHPECDLELLQRAYVFTAKVHEGQERLSGEPYLVHPIEVAGVLVELRLDEVTVAAGLLHDTIEDSHTTIEEIQRSFGSQVGFLVEGLTKIAKIEFNSAQERQAENFRKMLIAMSEDIRILLIKLADRLHNMRTVQHMPEEAVHRVAQETLDIYVPLAHRLGIHWMKQELEELSFRALAPADAADLEMRLRSKREARQAYIEEVIDVLSARLGSADVQAEVTGRLKDLYSIHVKMESQGVSLDEIYDVIAFRLVVDGSRDQVYAALGIVHALWRPVPGRFKDYVALPKPNGYQSLHTTVIGPYGERMEVQIRTHEMHRNAEFGIAAHWKYKEGVSGTGDSDDETFAWLRQLVEFNRELKDPHEFIDSVKVDLFPDQVFVFTPRGEVINLPKGATPIDFAYAIHSEVGAQCSGARVNGKMVPLRHCLENGDTVEVLTSHNQYPRKDWLDFVVSSRARSRIRHAIRTAETERSLALGRDMLERALRKEGFSLARLLEQGDLEEVARAERRSSVDQLLSAVGYGRVAAIDVVRRLRGEQAPQPAPKARRSLFRRRRRPSKSGIRVSGQPDVLVRFGRCCGPLPGDEVVGFVTRGRGVTIHVKDCPKVFELDPVRRIDVNWEPDAAAPWRIKMRVHSLDRPGQLAKVTKTISAAGINIGAARVTTTSDRKSVQTFDLWVSDVGTLNAVMREIGRIRGVVTVERMRT